MEPSPELVKRVHNDKVAAARRQTPASKFMAGPELFDYACSISMAGIRSQNPEYNDEQVRAELRRRLEIGRRIEERP